jgi:hypothetical protein
VSSAVGGYDRVEAERAVVRAALASQLLAVVLAAVAIVRALASPLRAT